MITEETLENAVKLHQLFLDYHSERLRMSRTDLESFRNTKLKLEMKE